MPEQASRPGSRRAAAGVLRRCGGCASCGYRHEPGSAASSFVLSLFAALPDALIALWLKFLGEGVLSSRPASCSAPRSASASRRRPPGFCAPMSTRVQRRFRDKVTIALESHVARLQASVATIAHHERPDYLDRLAMLRDQVFVLDHMYMSVFSTCGWILRLGVTIALLMSIHVALALLAVFAIPAVLASTWRPGVERAAKERAASPNRLARHLFTLATTAPPGQGSAGHRHRGAAGFRAPRGVGALVPGDCAGPMGIRDVAHARRGQFSARRTWAPLCLLPSVFGRPPGTCCSCWPPARGSRPTLARRLARWDFCAASGWTDPVVLAWLEDYAASLVAAAELPAPDAIHTGHSFRSRVVCLPRHGEARAGRHLTHTAGRHGRRHRG